MLENFPLCCSAASHSFVSNWDKRVVFSGLAAVFTQPVVEPVFTKGCGAQQVNCGKMMALHSLGCCWYCMRMGVVRPDSVPVFRGFVPILSRFCPGLVPVLSRFCPGFAPFRPICPDLAAESHLPVRPRAASPDRSSLVSAAVAVRNGAAPGRRAPALACQSAGTKLSKSDRARPQARKGNYPYLWIYVKRRKRFFLLRPAASGAAVAVTAFPVMGCGCRENAENRGKQSRKSSRAEDHANNGNRKGVVTACPAKT